MSQTSGPQPPSPPPCAACAGVLAICRFALFPFGVGLVAASFPASHACGGVGIIDTCVPCGATRSAIQPRRPWVVGSAGSTPITSISFAASLSTRRLPPPMPLRSMGVRPMVTAPAPFSLDGATTPIASISLAVLLNAGPSLFSSPVAKGFFNTSHAAGVPGLTLMDESPKTDGHGTSCACGTCSLRWLNKSAPTMSPAVVELPLESTPIVEGVWWEYIMMM
mmetsp:Transcript_33998/g.95610  ORF Transcript_33998/g.95610 Transcript_33998/m.95610 type:complete len:222 (+) Transcript_33998:509-1174(+)